MAIKGSWFESRWPDTKDGLSCRNELKPAAVAHFEDLLICCRDGNRPARRAGQGVTLEG
jgi:hypothetical protein